MKKKQKEEHTQKIIAGLFYFHFGIFEFPMQSSLRLYRQTTFICSTYIYLYIWYMYLCFNSVILCSHHFCFIGFRFLFASSLFFAALHVACLPPSMHFSPARKIIYVYSRLAI